MNSFFKGRIRWWDGLYLSPEHLEENNIYIENSICNLKNIFVDYINVNNLTFNELLLTRGILEVNTFKGMFGNLQYMEYDINLPIKITDKMEQSGRIYSISEDLNKFAKIINNTGLLMYLVIDTEKFNVIDNVNNVVVEKQINKLILLPEFKVKDLNIAIPVARIINQKGSFVIDETYIYPIINIKNNNVLFKYLEEFIKYLRKITMETASQFFLEDSLNIESIFTKINFFFKYHSLMPEILTLESLLYGGYHPLLIFLSLQKIIGSLSLLRFTNLPPLQIYNHNNIYQSLNNLIIIIQSMLNNLNTESDAIQMKIADNKFYIDIPKEIFSPLVKVYLFIEMEYEQEKDKIINWIEEARIYSDIYENDILEKRVRGLERNILNKSLFGNKIIIVELMLNSEYISVNSNVLYIYNNINNYIPKNILLSWRDKGL